MKRSSNWSVVAAQRVAEYVGGLVMLIYLVEDVASPWSQDTLATAMALNLVSCCQRGHLASSPLTSVHVMQGTTITSFVPDYLSTYLSLCPSPSDAVLSFGPMDFMLTSAPHYLPTRLYSVFPHPAQDPSEKRKYIVMLTSR